MSAFRMQRLLGKLLDAFSIQKHPSDYVDDLDADMIINYGVSEEAVNDLASSSTNPEKFKALSQSLIDTGCPEIGSIIHILSHLKSLKGASKSNSAYQTANLAPLSIEDDANFSVKEADEELDQIFQKLHQVSSKAFVSNFSNKIFTSDDSKILIRTFKNRSEICLGNHHSSVQELLLVEDLLTLLLGCKGTFVCIEHDGFTIDDTVPQSFIPLFSPTLELALNFSNLSSFCAICRSPNNGQIIQAFGTALESYLQDLGQLVVALEKRFCEGGFLLGQFNFYLLPFYEPFCILSELTSTIAEKQLFGGSLLNFLEANAVTHSGNSVYQSLLDRILIPTSLPFLNMLHSWLTEGKLDDRNKEFFIVENAMSDNPLEGYSLLEKNIPCALISSSSKVLLIGIYQSILSKNNQSSRPQISIDELFYDQTVLTMIINSLFISVNKAMVSILQINNGLWNILSLLKSIFLIEKADMISEFLDVSESELMKPSKEVDLLWLKRKLEEVWGFSEGIDHLHCRISDQNLFDQLLGIIGNTSRPSEIQKEKILNGFDGLLLDYDVSFPLNLIITKDCLSKYQIIFKLLFSTNHLMSRLDKKRKLLKLSPELKKFLTISKVTMSNFIKTYHSYLAYQVFQPQFNNLIKGIECASGIDKIISLHNDYLDTCLRECLLTNAKLVQLLSNLFTLTSRYCSLLDVLSGNSMKQLSDEELLNQIKQIESNFSKHIRIFLEALQYYSARDSDHYLGNLLSHLDFSSYYYNTAYNRQGNDNHPIAGLVTQQE